MTPPSGTPLGRRHTLLRRPAPSRSRPPHADYTFDLLRPRNIYVVVLMTVVVFVTVTAGGWLSPSSGRSGVAPSGTPGASTPAGTPVPTPSPTAVAAATPGSSPTPLAAPTSTPSATPTPSATSTPSATPASTPTVAELAAAYLRAATVVNKANGAASATWDRSRKTLTDAKGLAKVYAAADLAFIRAVQKIPWFGDNKTLARRVLTPDNQRYVTCGSAIAANTWAAYNVSWNDVDAANMQASAASNELRIALGLPPVPLLGR